jgi:DNA-binding response OmpR family regulator
MERELLREIALLIEERRTSPRSARNFLIVDHDATSAETIAGLIGNAGFGASILAASMDEARQYTAEFEPMVALVSITGPRDLDGIEVARRLHHEFGMRIVLMAETISAVPTDYPVNGFLIRSFTMEKLVNVLRTAVDAA